MTEKRIGVYVCWCGSNIARMVDVEKVSQYVAGLEDVVIARDYKYMCSDPGQDQIIHDIRDHNLNRIVVAACSPRIHELTFRKSLENAGLNPYLLEMANIREQVSWVHNDRKEATRKAISLVAAAINRVRWHESLDKRTVEINPATLVIGGGMAGMIAALEVADAGKQAYLIEISDRLGGIVGEVDLTFPYFDSTQSVVKSVIERVINHPNIEVYLSTQLKEVFGYIGNFETQFVFGTEEKKLEFGHIVVATGLKPFDPSGIPEYGYAKYPNVITSFQFESMLKRGRIVTTKGEEPKNVVIIHCVGSRNPQYHEYCSRTCCSTALKYANQIRSALPQASIYQIYADMRSYGKGCEELYKDTSRKNVLFMMFDQQKGLPRIRKGARTEYPNLVIELHEKLTGEDVLVPADMVILMVAMEAHETAKEVAHMTGISMCGNEFYIEKHPKLDPVATTTDGVFIVGSCQAPKDIPNTVAQARAATARILANISMGRMNVEVTTAVVNEELCCGCQTCISVCPYSAISYLDEKRVSNVNEILCKGCGTCGSTCPTGAIRSRHFTDQQILSEIKELIVKSKELLEV
ncbi:MAG: CoB--CoM heterodisulfide reductase iron-sulfur subunit A family protein [Bacteroidales bacterium]|jgi:heterodisulfide reductase subunit A|nr:CoB--CoM heterodisulfide reductase iron-sulfur subunit A family protein [Bacteroidales bacterium]